MVASCTRPAVLALTGLALLLLLCLGPGGISANKLKQMLQKQEENSHRLKSAPNVVPSDPDSRPPQLPFRDPLQKFENDITYWLNQDRNGHDYYGDYYQCHYDEDSAISPRSPHILRHGASVNYDDY